ncbi:MULTISPECIES: hypothetical protein [unclassified Kitasatospora]|uniref:hypothetical protein n=1 Tax=unclassified Kitasatospora TaxID=2633591 RepID=UPI00070A3980|nr:MULTISPECIES: hypothetical protein [unclassified Kitasatospora]KQV03387.1 hypothetical protein ASC99_16440 [Kitasatospora sp. Root107]KRB66028.1 hypothetical protein ASE03_31030 [Kitasatospora sp. Root187]
MAKQERKKRGRKKVRKQQPQPPAKRRNDEIMALLTLLAKIAGVIQLAFRAIGWIDRIKNWWGQQ